MLIATNQKIAVNVKIGKDQPRLAIEVDAVCYNELFAIFEVPDMHGLIAVMHMPSGISIHHTWILSDATGLVAFLLQNGSPDDFKFTNNKSPEVDGIVTLLEKFQQLPLAERLEIAPVSNI